MSVKGVLPPVPMGSFPLNERHLFVNFSNYLNRFRSFHDVSIREPRVKGRIRGPVQLTFYTGLWVDVDLLVPQTCLNLRPETGFVQLSLAPRSLQPSSKNRSKGPYTSNFVRSQPVNTRTESTVIRNSKVGTYVEGSVQDLKLLTYPSQRL